MIELPETEAVEHAGVIGETFVQRLVRQIIDAQHLPRFILRFITRFATGSYDSASTTPPVANISSVPLARDSFGFRKVIIVATDLGKLYALDSASGAILWSRVLGLGWANEIDGSLHPARLFVLPGGKESERREVVVIVLRKASNGLVDTVLFHVDAMNGSDLKPREAMEKQGEVLEGIDIIHGPAIGSYWVDVDHPFVLLLDEFRQVCAPS